MNLKDKIESLGTAETAEQLNAIHADLLKQLDETQLEDPQTRSDAEAALNHITNYNLVRIANTAYETFLASGSKDPEPANRVIRLCYRSLKDHEDVETERGLLDGLSDQLRTN